MTAVSTGSVPAKQCTDCGQVLPSTEFYWVSKSLGTLRGQCKACMRRSKAAQRDPAWTPNCSRCNVRPPERTGSGRRPCDDCFGQTYDLERRRANGAHRVRLKPCSLCGGPKERMARGKMCQACKPWAGYAKSLRRFDLTPADLGLSAAGEDDGVSTDPGWDIGNMGGHDYAVLHAMADGDAGDPWETDVGVEGVEPSPLHFPPLDLSRPEDPLVPDPSEYVVC